MSIQSMMREFREQTEPYIFTSTRVWRGVIAFELDPHHRSVGLGRICALQHGHASAALDWLGSLADRHGVKMMGVIEPFGEARLTRKQLAAWYRRHGWEITNGCYIDREPKQQERKAA